MLFFKSLRTLSRCSLVPLVFLSLGLSGCGSDRNVPTTAGREPGTADLAAGPVESVQMPGFFPLSIGNAWHYSGTATLWQFPGDPAPYVIDQIEHRVLIGTEDLFGRSYVVEQHTLIQDTRPPHRRLPELITSWIRYRQDRNGLYEADVDISDPPGAAGPANSTAAIATARGTAPTPRTGPDGLDAAAWARHTARREQILSILHGGGAGAPSRGLAAAGGPNGGVLPNEIIRLGYPLHPGAEWNIRPDPLYVSTVEGQDNVVVPAGRFLAWRIAITLPGLSGPNDRILIWYGRPGYIRDQVHLEDPVIGNYDEVMELQSLDLTPVVLTP